MFIFKWRFTCRSRCGCLNSRRSVCSLNTQDCDVFIAKAPYSRWKQKEALCHIIVHNYLGYQQTSVRAWLGFFGRGRTTQFLSPFRYLLFSTGRLNFPYHGCLMLWILTFLNWEQSCNYIFILCGPELLFFLASQTLNILIGDRYKCGKTFQKLFLLVSFGENAQCSGSHWYN